MTARSRTACCASFVRTDQQAGLQLSGIALKVESAVLLQSGVDYPLTNSEFGSKRDSRFVV